MLKNEAMSTFTRIDDRQYVHIAQPCYVDIPCSLREFADFVGTPFASSVRSVKSKADSICLRQQCIILTSAKFDGFEQPVAQMDPDFRLKDNLILCLNSAARTSMECPTLSASLGSKYAQTRQRHDTLVNCGDKHAFSSLSLLKSLSDTPTFSLGRFVNPFAPHKSRLHDQDQVFPS